MVCSDCGGAVSINVTNYDDVMHKEGCRRLKEIEIFKPIEALGLSPECVTGEKSIFNENNARCCPAWGRLMNDLGDRIIPMRCSKQDECYLKFFKKHEEVVINTMIKLEEMEG